MKRSAPIFARVLRSRDCFRRPKIGYAQRTTRDNPRFFGTVTRIFHGRLVSRMYCDRAIPQSFRIHSVFICFRSRGNNLCEYNVGLAKANHLYACQRIPVCPAWYRAGTHVCFALRNEQHSVNEMQQRSFRPMLTKCMRLVPLT